MQESQSIMLLIEVDSAIDERTESLQIPHFNSMVSRRHIRH
jgi:hypothetical protein